MTTNRPELALNSHWAIAVATFPHSLPQGTGPLEALWQPWHARLNDGEIDALFDDSWFFLPHVRRLLFPEFCGIRHGTAADAKNAARARREQSVSSLLASSAANSVLRLTLKPALVAQLKGAVILEAGGGGEEIGLEVDWIDLAFFPGGVASLMIRFRVRPLTGVLRSSMIVSANNRLRWVQPPQLNRPLAEWRIPSASAGSHTFHTRSLLDYLLQGLNESLGARVPVQDLRVWLADQRPGITTEFTNSEAGEAYVDRLNFYTYCDVELAEWDAATAPSQSAAGFGNRRDQALYELVTARNSSRPEYQLSAKGATQFIETSAFTTWNDWRMATHDGSVAFIAARDSGFIREAFPFVVGGDYFYLYLLTTLQRSWMRRIHERLVQSDLSAIRNLPGARRLWQEYLTYMNKFSFAELTPRLQGRELHAKFKEAMEINDLLEELSHEVKVIGDHFEELTKRRTTQLLSFISFIGFPMSISLTVYTNSTLVPNPSRGGVLLLVLSVALAGAGVWKLLRKLALG